MSSHLMAQQAAQDRRSAPRPRARSMCGSSPMSRRRAALAEGSRARAMFPLRASQRRTTAGLIEILQQFIGAQHVEPHQAAQMPPRETMAVARNHPGSSTAKPLRHDRSARPLHRVDDRFGLGEKDVRVAWRPAACPGSPRHIDDLFLRRRVQARRRDELRGAGSMHPASGWRAISAVSWSRCR